MATSFPAGLDNFTDYVDGTTVMEAATLNDMQKAIEALEAKVGITDSAVASSHDYKIDALENSTVLNYDGATELRSENFDAANTFYDVNASGVVGANRALLLIKLVTNADIYIAVRAKGEGGTGAAWGSDEPSYERGVHHCKLSSNGDIGTLIVATDAAGKFQIAGHAITPIVTVTLIAYIL